MLIPPTIIAIATSRNASIPPLADFIRNLGKIRLTTSVYRATKTGRLPMIVETKDTGPLCIAQNDSTIPAGANVSLKASKAMAELLCCISRSCLSMQGRSEISKKIPDIQNT